MQKQTIFVSVLFLLLTLYPYSSNADWNNEDLLSFIEKENKTVEELKKTTGFINTYVSLKRYHFLNNDSFIDNTGEMDLSNDSQTSEKQGGNKKDQKSYSTESSGIYNEANLEAKTNLTSINRNSSPEIKNEDNVDPDKSRESTSLELTTASFIDDIEESSGDDPGGSEEYVASASSTVALNFLEPVYSSEDSESVQVEEIFSTDLGGDEPLVTDPLTQPRMRTKAFVSTETPDKQYKPTSTEESKTSASVSETTEDQGENSQNSLTSTPKTSTVLTDISRQTKPDSSDTSSDDKNASPLTLVIISAFVLRFII
ncbi:hypothetical protein CDIK_1423 [Cucumispora dikerogammari]|nr:hypothetical protein CDIK_1423 [Cucumispora dikerogammari]